MKNKKMQHMFIVDMDTVMEIIELAQKNGKKAGDSMQEEFEIILKKYPKKFEFLGATKKDVDMLTGNLREKGLKIFNLKEIDRKKRRRKNV